MAQTVGHEYEIESVHFSSRTLIHHHHSTGPELGAGDIMMDEIWFYL